MSSMSRVSVDSIFIVFLFFSLGNFFFFFFFFLQMSLDLCAVKRSELVDVEGSSSPDISVLLLPIWIRVSGGILDLSFRPPFHLTF